MCFSIYQAVITISYLWAEGWALTEYKKEYDESLLSV